MGGYEGFCDASGRKWYTATESYKSTNSVIFNDLGATNEIIDGEPAALPSA